MSDRIPAIKVLLLPKDTNALGTIFGGVILSHIDLASAVEARKTAAHRFVTKAIREVEFHSPVFVGDIVNDRQRLYFLSLIAAVGVYALIRYLIRTPFGISFQGVRDEPVRMASLGYNVALHRTLAFGIGAFVSRSTTRPWSTRSGAVGSAISTARTSPCASEISELFRLTFPP